MNNVVPMPQTDAARADLLRALNMIQQARDTQGKPGGQANLMAAEIACGRFVATHEAVLRHMLAVQGIDTAKAAPAAAEVRNVA